MPPVNRARYIYALNDVKLAGNGLIQEFDLDWEGWLMQRKVFQLGDIVRMKKKHPCGSFNWEVVRMGADIKIRCQGCGRLVMMPRSEFERRMIRVEEKPQPS
jgi:hypothetical protein